MVKSYIIAVFVLGTYATVNSLQCYQCNDCPSILNETYLVTCGKPVNPDNGTDTNPDNSNNGTDSNPLNPNNGTDTNPDNPNNGTDTNPDNPNNGTDTNPDNPNNGTDTNPDNPNNGTDTNPDNPNNGTNTNPDNPNNGTETNPNNSNNGTDNNRGNPNTETTKQVLRVRRSIELDIDTNKACLCYGMECSCDEEGAILRAVTFDNTTWMCGSATFKQNGTEYKYKRCVAEKVNGEEFCTWLKNASAVLATTLADNTTELTECNTCTADKCNGSADDDNGASSIQSSVLVATLTFVTVFSVSI